MLNSSKCCVPECISHRSKSKWAFHKIPRNKILAQKWLQTINNPELVEVLKSARVCGRHFERRQYKNLRKNILKEGVTPVLFMPKAAVNAESDVEQFNIVHNTLEQRFVPNNALEDSVLPEISSNQNESDTSSSKLYDFKKTCRICLLEKDDLQTMESDFIQTMFQSCNVLKFSDLDTYPKRMCSVCLAELKIVYSFSMKCAISNYVSRQYTDKLDITNSEEIMDSCVAKMQGLSKTVEVSYVPSGTERRNSENNARNFKYTLISVDGIEKPDLASLFSITRQKERSSTTVKRSTIVKPVLSSSIQSYEIQSSEKPKRTNVSSTNSSSFLKETINTLSLEHNPTVSSISTTNKSTFSANSLPENRSSTGSKYVKENRTNSIESSTEVASIKRVLRKRKFNQTATVTGDDSPSQLVKKTVTTPGCVLPTVKNNTELDKSPKKDAPEPVRAICQQTETKIQDLIEETHECTSRTSNRPSRILSRTAGRESRSKRRKSRSKRSKSRSKRSKSRSSIRPQGLSIRKTVASGNAVYWYDKKSTDSLADQLDSVPLVKRIQDLEKLDTSADYELLGFDTNGQSVVTESNGMTSDSNTVTATAASIVPAEVIVNTERSAELSAHSDKNEPPVIQNKNTFLKGQLTRTSTEDGTTNSGVQIQKRGRGRPRKRRTVLPTGMLERPLRNRSEPRISNPAICCSKIDSNAQCNNESDNRAKVIAESDKCNIENSTECNSIERSTKNIKTAKRSTKTSTGLTNITENNNVIVEQTQISDNKNGYTAQHVLPTEEQVTSSSQLDECQHNSTKITKQNKSTRNIVENEGIYMKLRHKNVKFNVNPQKKSVKSLNLNVSIKHLDISKKEVDRLLSVKLELNKFKIKNKSNQFKGVTDDGTEISGSTKASKKKVHIYNKPTIENNIRTLRSSKRNIFNNISALSNSNRENITLTKDIHLKSVPKLNHDIVDTDVDIKNVCESNKLTLTIAQKQDVHSSYEIIKPNAYASLENDDKCSVNKVEEIVCLANTKDETGLKNSSGQGTCKIQVDDRATLCKTKVKNDTCEYDTCLLNIKTELNNRCEADTTTTFDTWLSESKVDHGECLPTSKEENECSLKSIAACGKYSPDSKADSVRCLPNTNIEPLHGKTEYETCSLNSTTEYDTKPEHNSSLANIEHATYVPDNEKTPVNIPVVDCETDTGSKRQLVEQLHEFIVFPVKDCAASRAEQNGGAIREVDAGVQQSPNNYYQPLAGTNNSFTRPDNNAQVINTDAMLTNGLHVSPELKAEVPTVSDEELNDSFEKTINTIFNTEYNSVCDGQVVGSGIALDDVANEETVLPTEDNETEPVSYQHANEQSPRFRINCDSVYFNKRGGMIVTSLPAEETGDYTSEDEYYSSRFHNAWIPVVQLQPPTDYPSVIFDNVIVEPVETVAASTSDASDNIVIKYSGVVVPAQPYNTAQNYPYKCKVCYAAFRTNEQLTSHTIHADHVTKRFCKHCKRSLDIAEYESHMARHQNEEVFCCEYCGVLIQEAKRFTRHRRTHRRHQCQLCTMQFDTKFLLSEHLTVHTGVRRDRCKHCHRTFCRTSTLITHLAARTCLKGKEKFACIICSKMFASKRKSIQHVRVHQRYECTICSRTFSYAKYCKNHLRLVHGITQNA